MVFNTRALTSRLSRAVTSGPFNRIGKETVKDIQKTARSGISPATGKKFAPLKDSTKKNRGRLSKINNTHSKYSKNRSNLTFTGQLINAVSFAVVPFGDRVEINLFIKATPRKPYKTGKGSRAKNTPDNATLAGFLETKTGSRAARTILGVTNRQQGKIREIIRKHLNLEIKKINT